MERSHTFPLASQPEIMRAHEKDEEYLEKFCEEFREVMKVLAGGRVVDSQLEEVKVAATVLFYLLTTGTGMQTLGEEYCSIHQISEVSSTAPEAHNRLLLVFLHALCPYILEKLSTRVIRHAESRIIHEDLINVNSLTPTQIPEQRRRLSVILSRQSWTLMYHRILRYLHVILPAVKKVIPFLFRLNLMLFYFKGKYFHLSKRLLGIQYIFSGRPQEHRPRYGALGIFLLLEMAITCGGFLKETVVPNLRSFWRGKGVQLSGVVVVDEEGKVLPKKDLDSRNEDRETKSKCPLCLSVRVSPTATPCGHVFCWKCIADWGNEKLECPLCRTRFLHNNLLCIYHSDF